MAKAKAREASARVGTVGGAVAARVARTTRQRVVVALRKERRRVMAGESIARAVSRDMTASIRDAVGYTDTSAEGRAAWDRTTMGEIAAALTRRAWCAKHGTVRVSWCAMCRVAKRGEP